MSDSDLSIWWLSGRSPHSLDVPVIGRFEHGVGTFFVDSAQLSGNDAHSLSGGQASTALGLVAE